MLLEAGSCDGSDWSIVNGKQGLFWGVIFSGQPGMAGRGIHALDPISGWAFYFEIFFVGNFWSRNLCGPKSARHFGWGWI